MGSKREDDSNAASFMIDELSYIIPEENRSYAILTKIQNKLINNKFLNDSEMIILQNMYEKWTE